MIILNERDEMGNSEPGIMDDVIGSVKSGKS